MFTEFKLFSSEFNHTESIPSKYTADGMNINPPLKWEGAPPETKSYVLIVDDPDNKHGVFTIWLVKNIPYDVNSINEGSIPGCEILNSSHVKSYCAPKLGYGTHRYFFRLYALSNEKFEANDIHHFYKDVERQKIGEAVLMAKYMK